MTTADLSVTIVDAFTRHPGAGNRAGVMLDAPPLDAEEMMAIARAVSASETAFLLPPSAGADFAMRYFSPAAEVDFCGHATVATFHLLAETGRVQAAGRYVFDCPAGRLEVELEPIGDHCRVWIATRCLRLPTVKRGSRQSQLFLLQFIRWCIVSIIALADLAGLRKSDFT